MKPGAFEQQAPRLRAVALKAAATAGANADTAQDVAQETMIRLWQLRDDPRLVNLDGYAATIARHLTLNLSRRRPQISLDERHCAEPAAPSPLDLLVEREQEQWLWQRINQLPPTQHAVLRLRQVERQPNERIAALLGIKPSSVSTLLARARRQLLEDIRQQREQEAR